MSTPQGSLLEVIIINFCKEAHLFKCNFSLFFHCFVNVIVMFPYSVLYLPFQLIHPVITQLNAPQGVDPSGQTPRPPTSLATATEALVDLSRQIVNVTRPRLARNPVAASFADYAGSRLDNLDKELMNECTDEMYASILR